MRTANAQKKMKKKEIHSSNGFEPEVDIPIDVRREFEERRRTHQEKSIFRIASFDPRNLLIPAELQPKRGDCHVDYCISF